MAVVTQKRLKTPVSVNTVEDMESNTVLIVAYCIHCYKLNQTACQLGEPMHCCWGRGKVEGENDEHRLIFLTFFEAFMGSPINLQSVSEIYT